MKSWQLALQALDHPRTLLELACAMSTSAMVAGTAVNILVRYGGATLFDGRYSRTPRGSAYLADLDPKDHASMMGDDGVDIDAIVEQAKATQPTSVFDLVRTPR